MGKPTLGWSVVWGVWVGLGLLMEAISLRTGSPLTLVARRYILSTAAGSFVVGAFLSWLPYHWLLDTGGLDVTDLAVPLLGGLGAIGLWAYRLGQPDTKGTIHDDEPETTP